MTTPRSNQAPTLPEPEADNVVKEEQEKGEVRPDGPGDDTAPVEPDPDPRAPARGGAQSARR
ncbi:MAG: hypothetical protein AB7T06_30035 [Kofleriaceae bacterium]